MDPATHEAILGASAGLALGDHVVVDLRVAQSLARRLLDCSATSSADDVSSSSLELLSKELLPDWYDDWVVAEAEDWRQLRANALEALARLMTEDGRLADAAGAARAAIKVEPLRESAHAALIAVHLAEGNQAEALRVFDRFRALLLAALDLEPTKNLAEMVSVIQKV
jgi:DNA-binding SARP family transcriptional activator